MLWNWKWLSKYVKIFSQYPNTEFKGSSHTQILSSKNSAISKILFNAYYTPTLTLKCGLYILSEFYWRTLSIFSRKLTKATRNTIFLQMHFKFLLMRMYFCHTIILLYHGHYHDHYSKFFNYSRAAVGIYASHKNIEALKCMFCKLMYIAKKYTCVLANWPDWLLAFLNVSNFLILILLHSQCSS